MRILKDGSLNPVKFQCPVCGCEFMADCTEYEADVIDSYRMHDGAYVPIVINATIDCPFCETRCHGKVGMQ